MIPLMLMIINYNPELGDTKSQEEKTVVDPKIPMKNWKLVHGRRRRRGGGGEGSP